jgi:hypothetical protein
MANENLINYAIGAVLIIILYKISKYENFNVNISKEGFASSDQSFGGSSEFNIPTSTLEVFNNVAEIAKRIMVGSSLVLAGDFVQNGDLTIRNGALYTSRSLSTGLTGSSVSSNNNGSLAITDVNNDANPAQYRANIDLLGKDGAYIRLADQMGQTTLESLRNNENLYNFKIDNRGNIRSSENLALYTSINQLTSRMTPNTVELFKQGPSPSSDRTVMITPDYMTLYGSQQGASGRVYTPFFNVNMKDGYVNVTRKNSNVNSFVLDTFENNAVIRFKGFDAGTSSVPDEFNGDKMIIDRNGIQIRNTDPTGKNNRPAITLVADEANTKIMVSQGIKGNSTPTDKPSVIIHESGLQVNMLDDTRPSVILGNNKNLQIGRYTIADTEEGLAVFKTEGDRTTRYILAP